MTMINDVYEFRPIINDRWYEIRRYADGKWIPDDGECDLAFAYMERGAPMVLFVEMPYRKFLLWSLMRREGEEIKKHPRENPWHYMYVKGKKQLGRSWDKDKHPNEIAGRSGMNFMANKHSCSNGRGVDFNPTDKHIKAGLVRNRETKEIIKPPEIFDCCYCGKLEKST